MQPFSCQDMTGDTGQRGLDMGMPTPKNACVVGTNIRWKSAGQCRSSIVYKGVESANSPAMHVAHLLCLIQAQFTVRESDD
jgi:hypothetical protein